MNVCIPKEQAVILKEQLLKGEIGPNEIAKMLPEEKAAVKAILEDLVTEKLNISASPAEVRAISIKAKKIDEAQAKLGDDLGDPKRLKETVDFFKAKKDMDDYLQAHNPAPKLRVATGTIGRGAMLASVKSPLLNIGSNIELGITEGISRRIANRGLQGTDNALAKDYVKMVNTVYQKTGYDLSRMTALSDLGANGGRVLDDVVHSQGKGGVRRTGRFFEDTVFKQLMGAPDVLSGSLHFADSVNLAAIKVAKGNKTKARAFMDDAMRLEPKTPEGQLLRDQGILDAQVATWTNKTWATKVTLGIRKILNDLSGDLRFGDFALPFVKTPANVVATSLDYAGVGIPKAMVKLVKGIKAGDLGNKQNVQAMSRDLTRAGMGLTAVAVFASNLSPDNFMGAYDPARAQIEQLKNSRENSVKIGGKWISTDWFGPLSVPLTAAMYAKKYGKGGDGKALAYGGGLLSATANLPGIEDAADFAESLVQKKPKTAGELVEGTGDYALKEGSARLIPSIISDTANATDPYVRQGGKGWAGVKMKVPGFRQSLPIKRNVFGEEVKGESPATEILFGSRVKSDRGSKVTAEIERVAKANDVPITFTDWDKSTTKALTEFKAKVGQEKFDKAKVKYGQELEKSLRDLFQPESGYGDLSDEEQLDVIRNRDSEIQKQVFKQYGFKASKTKKKKNSLKYIRS